MYQINVIRITELSHSKMQLGDIYENKAYFIWVKTAKPSFDILFILFLQVSNLILASLYILNGFQVIIRLHCVLIIFSANTFENSQNVLKHYDSFPSV